MYHSKVILQCYKKTTDDAVGKNSKRITYTERI